MSMEQGKAFVYEKACTWCGKHFGVLHVDLWAYKRRDKYFCSWKCLRAYEKNKGDTKLRKVTLEDKKKAVEIAINGGDALAFLATKCDDPTQMWARIRNSVKDTDPETFAKLPKRVDKPKKAPAVEIPEAQEAENGGFFSTGKVVKEPEATSDITVSAIRHKKFGEFYHDIDHNCVDWRTPEGEEVSMSIPGIKELYKLFPVLMKKLGVEL